MWEEKERERRERGGGKKTGEAEKDTHTIGEPNHARHTSLTTSKEGKEGENVAKRNHSTLDRRKSNSHGKKLALLARWKLSETSTMMRRDRALT